jgi:hypothetical protein
VRTARRQCERRARAVAVQTTRRVEHVEQRKEVVLVGAAPVEEHERAAWGSFRRPLASDHALPLEAPPLTNRVPGAGSAAG